MLAVATLVWLSHGYRVGVHQSIPKFWCGVFGQFVALP